MGTIKQLLPWKGTVLINHMVKVASSSLASEVVVVLGANAGEIRQVLDRKPGVTIIENKSWTGGLGKSIARGMEFLMKKRPENSAVLVMLCDQPLIETSYLDRIINSFHSGKGKIIATTYGRHNGVPALFSAPFFPELLALENDFGARELLKKHEADIYGLGTGNSLLDLDTRQDYESLLGK
jgi:molybdenum cofactor cytidylyltransferase